MKLWNKFATAAILPLMFAAGQASAADAVDCGQASNWVDQSVINQQMGAAGQSIIYAKAIVIQGSGKNARMNGGVILTTNDDHTEGYIIRTNNPPGEKSTKGCIFRRMANLRFNDATKPGIAPGVLLKSTDAEAASACDKLNQIDPKNLPRASCAPYNNIIRRSEPNGERVMVQGFEVKKQSNGSYVQNGWLTTVTANFGSVDDNPSNPAAGITSSIMSTQVPAGATFVDTTLVYMRYTDPGLAMIRGPKLAAN